MLPAAIVIMKAPSAMTRTLQNGGSPAPAGFNVRVQRIQSVASYLTEAMGPL